MGRYTEAWVSTGFMFGYTHLLLRLRSCEKSQPEISATKECTRREAPLFKIIFFSPTAGWGVLAGVSVLYRLPVG